jgi:isoquinoline 1-oxidoreductase subunit beta
VVHNHLIGGGSGRRLEIDGVTRAVQIAKQVDGPVKVVWTREEDIQHDMYRPYFFDRMSAGLDERGMPVAWNHRFAGSSILARWAPPMFNNGLDGDTTNGAINLVYALPNMHVEYLRVEPPGIPTAFWRSVGPSHNVFVTESFMDELAAAAKQDPVAYRRALLDKAPRAKAVLELAAEKAGWGQPCLTGWAVVSPSSSSSRPIWRRSPKSKCRTMERFASGASSVRSIAAPSSIPTPSRHKSRARSSSASRRRSMARSP